MKDILGDLFEGAISYGEHQQYMTPMPVCRMMARLAIEESGQDEIDPPVPSAEGVPATPAPDSEPPTLDVAPKRVCDPCCGSGRMLLAVAETHRHWEFVGQDVDLRCVRMTALNLAFRNLYGYVIWGNTLALEQKLVYRTGFNGSGVIREIPLSACPALVQREVHAENAESPATPKSQPSVVDEPTVPKSQLRLF